MITDAGRAHLTRVRRGLLLRCAVLAASLAGLAALAAWVFASGRDPLGGPWLIIAVFLGFWAVFVAASPFELLAVNADLAGGESETIRGRAELTRVRAPGLVSLDHRAVLIAGRRYRVDARVIGDVLTGDEAEAVIAQRSGVLLEMRRATETRLDDPPVEPPSGVALTRRDRRLLRLIGQGLSDKEIARELNLAPATVRAYNSELYAKLGVANRTQAARYAPQGD